MIRKYLSKASNPAVMFSGGLDSLLTLWMVRQERDVDVITLRQNFSKLQWGIIDKLIKEWDLTVITAPPLRSYIVPNGEYLARIDEYQFGRTALPVLRDFEDGKDCSLQMDNQTLDYAFPYDVVFTGAKKEDWSAATGMPMGAEVVEKDGVTFVQPLFHWTKKQVMAEVQRLGLPYTTEWYDGGDERYATDTIHACTNCMKDEKEVYCHLEQKQIETVEWDRKGMLNAFQTRFGFIGA